MEGEHTCTLYVCIAVPESKLKFRKGRNLGWSRIPAHITDRLNNTPGDLIHNLPELETIWQSMVEGTPQNTSGQPDHTPPSQVVMNEEDAQSSQSLIPPPV